MVTVAIPVAGQIWRDDCYYLDGKTCKPKYFLIVAIAADGDLITLAFTSKSHGLPESPACFMGPPRAGYFVGAPGGVLTRPTWADFNNLQDVDATDFSLWQKQSRVNLIPRNLPLPTHCGVLRCLLGFDDLTGRQARIIGDLVAKLGCP